MLTRAEAISGVLISQDFYCKDPVPFLWINLCGTLVLFRRLRWQASMRNKATNLAVIYLVLMLGPIEILAQSKAGAGKSPLCTRENALDMIKQQVDVTKTISNPLPRITVLIRAADLLWPHEQERARAVFTQAFEIASESEKENEQSAPRALILRMQVPDQRYVVIQAVAKRDSAFAKELIQKMLKPDREASPAKEDPFNDVLTGARLLDSANKLVATDTNAALDLARVSLNYPAGFMLAHFLYRLAEVNQQAADQFYAQALTAYADRPMREFLYLQAYPFAWREMLNTPVFSFFPQIPDNFVPNQSLQRRFVQILLRRAHRALEEPLDPRDTYQDPNQAWMPGTVRILEGLMKLEPHVRASLPDLLGALTDAREKILVSLSVETQKLFRKPGREAAITPAQTFDEQIESAQKVADVNERDELMGTAVLSNSSDKQSLARVIEVIDKISHSNVRAHLLEMVHFRRSATAINARRFDEAEKLAARVAGHEQRAYLYVEIAKGLLKTNETLTHGREVLDRAIIEAEKAGVTIFAARTLLTASSLYAKIDLNRSVSLLADAVSCINRIDSPDFAGDDQSQEKSIRRPDGSGHFIFRFYMPGLDPESAFREMAKNDFDTALNQSSALTHKLQRALTTLALADVCLQSMQKQRRENVRPRPNDPRVRSPH